jgi:hypothetical protein
MFAFLSKYFSKSETEGFRCRCGRTCSFSDGERCAGACEQWTCDQCSMEERCCGYAPQHRALLCSACEVLECREPACQPEITRRQAIVAQAGGEQRFESKLFIYNDPRLQAYTESASPPHGGDPVDWTVSREFLLRLLNQLNPPHGYNLRSRRATTK